MCSLHYIPRQTLSLQIKNLKSSFEQYFLSSSANYFDVID